VAAARFTASPRLEPKGPRHPSSRLSWLRFLLAPWQQPPRDAWLQGKSGIRLFLLSLAVAAVLAMALSLTASYSQSHTFFVVCSNQPPKPWHRTPTWSSAFCRYAVLTIGPYPVWFACVYLLHRTITGFRSSTHRNCCRLSARFAVPYVLTWCCHHTYPYIFILAWSACPWIRGPSDYQEMVGDILIDGVWPGLTVLGLCLLVVGLVRNLVSMRKHAFEAPRHVRGEPNEQD